MHRVKLAMKIGGEYKLRQIGKRQWKKFAQEARLNPDELIERLNSMAKQLPDEINVARKLAHKEGLDRNVIDRLASRLIEIANDCQRILTTAS